MTIRITILNGPNLNLLGVREPHIYGSTTLDAVEASCRALGEVLDAEVEFHQTNHEGTLVDQIQAARERADAIIINPAGYSFTSVPIVDAMKIFEGPVIELHISNIHAREAFRHHSVIAPVCLGQISGFGWHSYRLGLEALLRWLEEHE